MIDNWPHNMENAGAPSGAMSAPSRGAALRRSRGGGGGGGGGGGAPERASSRRRRRRVREEEEEEEIPCLYPHFMCANDTNIVRRVFDDVRDVIIRTAISSFSNF